MQYLIIGTLFSLLYFSTGVSAQIFWKHKTSDIWLNPETKKRDSTIAFTTMSSYGKSVTAAGVLSNFPSNPIGRRIVFYRSNDGGLTWYEQPHLVPNVPEISNWGITKLQQIDSLHAVGIGDYGTIYRTSDAGMTWHRHDAPVKRELLDIHFSDPLTGIVLSVGYDSIIFTTTDGGEHWTNRPFSKDNIFSCYSYGNGKFSFYRYGHGPIYTTNDNFASLDTSPLIMDKVSDPKGNYVFARLRYANNDTMFAYGAYWPNDTNNAFASYATIMRTVNGGKSWEKPWIFPTEYLAQIEHITSPNRDTIFAGGVYVSNYLISTDHGTSWNVDTLLTDTSYNTSRCFGFEMMPDGHPLAIYGFPGLLVTSIIWRGEYSKSSVEVIEVIKYRTHFYPNPSTGTVSIESVDKSGAEIKVLDILGREVYQGKLSNQGTASLDLHNLPTGIYYIVFNSYGMEFIVGKIALTIE